MNRPGGQVQDSNASEGRGQGCRKAILINEHFVVYGVPAIAVPVYSPVEVEVTVRRGAGLRVLVHSATGEDAWHVEDTDRFEAVRRILRSIGLSEAERMIQIQCVDDLSGWSGLGSSAGFCVALARALCKALDRACTDEEVNRFAYEGEKVFAANPSGIDNTVATFGRALCSREGEARPGSGSTSIPPSGWSSATPGFLPGPAMRWRGSLGSEKRVRTCSRVSCRMRQGWPGLCVRPWKVGIGPVSGS